MSTHPFAFIVPVIVFVISIAHFVISGEHPYGRDKPYANRTKIFQEFQQEKPKLTKGLGEPTRIFHAHKKRRGFCWHQPYISQERNADSACTHQCHRTQLANRCQF